jgi:hypothetical protein
MRASTRLCALLASIGSARISSRLLQIAGEAQRRTAFRLGQELVLIRVCFRDEERDRLIGIS